MSARPGKSSNGRVALVLAAGIGAWWLLVPHSPAQTQAGPTTTTRHGQHTATTDRASDLGTQLGDFLHHIMHSSDTTTPPTTTKPRR
jgi:hypothetical protein